MRSFTPKAGFPPRAMPTAFWPRTARCISAARSAAGGQVSDVARLTWFVTDKSVYLAHQAEVGAAYREVFGKHFPAMSMVVVADLIEDEALVEIEATAHIG